MLGRIFGGKKEAAAPNPQEAISKLRETEEMLLKKQEFVEKKIKAVRFIVLQHFIYKLLFRKQILLVPMHHQTDVLHFKH